LWNLTEASGRAQYSEEAQRFNNNQIKVAIIDNGVDRIQSTLKKNIAKGVSYVTADSENGERTLPWWMVADTHGTLMTSVIQTVNPFCQLYIARVGKGRKDILPTNAAKVCLVKPSCTFLS